MVVLRCPYCGEKIRQGEQYCPHCGKEIDKPHIDEVDSAFQDIGGIMITIIGFIILWFILLIVVGFIGNLLHFGNRGLLFILAFVLTVVITAVIKLK